MNLTLPHFTKSPIVLILAFIQAVEVNNKQDKRIMIFFIFSPSKTKTYTFKVNTSNKDDVIDASESCPTGAIKIEEN